MTEARTPIYISPILENTMTRAEFAASRSVFDQIIIGVAATMPTPVMAKTGIISRSTIQVPEPPTAAKAIAWMVAIELKSMDAPRVLPTSQSRSWKIMRMTKKA